MKKTQTAALLESFALAFHCERHFAPVCEDAAARRLFSDGEFSQLGNTVMLMMQTLEPSFSGTPEAALTRAVDAYLLPLPAARDAFCMRALRNAAQTGSTQALFIGAGYGTIPLRQTERLRRMRFYELESPSLLRDKRARLCRAGIGVPENVRYQAAELRAPDWTRRFLQESDFDRSRRTFCALPGLAASCAHRAFWQQLCRIRPLLAPGSTVVLDYPAGPDGYTAEEMEKTLPLLGFRVCEHLAPEDAAEQLFASYNAMHPSAPMKAPGCMNFCTMVRKADP
ncbi:MAG: class I SAM-dependent methyltransferase [Hominenteromicrobium sp.]